MANHATSKSLFFKAKHPRVAKRICIKTIKCAQLSVHWLSGEWAGASRSRKKLLKQSAVVAANRAGVISEHAKRPEVRREKAKIQQLYQNWYEGHILPSR